MNETIVKKINELLVNIVKQTKDNADEQIKKIDIVRAEMYNMIPANTPERLIMEANIAEAKGDIHLRCKKPSEAENCYSDMLETIRKLYMEDKKAHGYAFAKAARKHASLYELLLGLNNTVPLPRNLSDTDSKLLSNAELLHKEAIGATYTSDEKVDAKIVRLHADSYYRLGCINSVRNNIAEAEMHFKNALGLEKAIFAALRTKDQSLLVSRSESALNVLYMMQKKHREAIEHNKKAIERLKEIEPTEPAFFGRNLAMAHLYMAKSYSELEGEEDNALKEYLTAIEKIIKVNAAAENKYSEDVIMYSVAVGDFFQRRGMPANASVYYNNAVSNVKNLPDGKCSKACKTALDRITGRITKEKL